MSNSLFLISSVIFVTCTGYIFICLARRGCIIYIQVNIIFTTFMWLIIHTFYWRQIRGNISRVECLQERLSVHIVVIENDASKSRHGISKSRKRRWRCKRSSIIVSIINRKKSRCNNWTCIDIWFTLNNCITCTRHNIWYLMVTRIHFSFQRHMCHAW